MTAKSAKALRKRMIKPPPSSTLPSIRPLLLSTSFSIPDRLRKEAEGGDEEGSLGSTFEARRDFDSREASMDSRRLSGSLDNDDMLLHGRDAV